MVGHDGSCIHISARDQPIYCKTLKCLGDVAALVRSLVNGVMPFERTIE